MLSEMEQETSVVKAEHVDGRNWQNFPAGLKVLVVDDDPLCLKIIEQMLKRCNYEGMRVILACVCGSQCWPGDVQLYASVDVQFAPVPLRPRRLSSCVTRPTLSTWYCRTCTCQVSSQSRPLSKPRAL